MQGEIFYGVKCAVPAFGFFQDATLRRMFDAEAAARSGAGSSRQQGRGIARRAEAPMPTSTPAAPRSRISAPRPIGWQGFLKSLNPLTLAGIVLWHGWSVIRSDRCWSFVELWMAIYDILTGARDLRQLGKEIKFIASRVAVSVLLRELVTIGASHRRDPRLADRAREFPGIRRAGAPPRARVALCTLVAQGD